MDLRKKIKEELLNEQNISNYDCHHFMLCDQPLYQGQHVLTPFVANAWPGWPATNNAGYGQYFSQASTNFWNAVGSPSLYEVVKVNATAGNSANQTSDLCWKYIGNYACYNGGTFYWDSINSVSPIVPQGPNSCTDCAAIVSPLGCTDTAATNYDSNATQDDGSCEGCMDQWAQNHCGLCTIDDGSCTYLNMPQGCMNPSATNFDPMAIIDDGSCDYGWRCKEHWKQMAGLPGKCVVGDVNNIGQFATKQDCLSSGCEPLQADDSKDILPAGPVKKLNKPEDEKKERKMNKELKEEIKRYKQLL